MTRRVKNLAVNALYILAVIGIALAVWAISALAVDSKFILPSVPDTFVALGEVFALSEFWRGLGGTLMRSAASFAISVTAAALLFYVCSVSRPAERIIGPFVSALRTLPTMAVSLILAIWVGAGWAPVLLGVLVIMPMVYSALRARTATIPVELTEVARLCGATRTQRFFAVTLPTALSALPESLSSALSFNIKIVIAAEILMQTAGSLGMLMNAASSLYKTAMLIAFVFIAVAVSVAAEYALRAILRAALRRFCDDAA